MDTAIRMSNVVLTLREDEQLGNNPSASIPTDGRVHNQEINIIQPCLSDGAGIYHQPKVSVESQSIICWAKGVVNNHTGRVGIMFVGKIADSNRAD